MEEERVENEKRIRKYLRYAGDSLLILRDKEKELKDKVKKMEAKKRKRQKISFLDVEIIKDTGDSIKIRWYWKEYNAGISCNRRNNVDEATKTSHIRIRKTKRN